MISIYERRRLDEEKTDTRMRNAKKTKMATLIRLECAILAVYNPSVTIENEKKSKNTTR